MYVHLTGTPVASLLNGGSTIKLSLSITDTVETESKSLYRGFHYSEVTL